MNKLHHEIKLRRWAKNKNLFLKKPRIRNKKDSEYGTYQLIINATGEIKRKLTIEEAEEFILKY